MLLVIQAYVCFYTAEDVEKALEKNNKNMGHRYNLETL